MESHDQKKVEGGLRLKGNTKQKPLITIVTVVWNGESTIERAVRSVINQTCREIEYVVIDGNSTDQTRGIIEKYDSKIDFWMSEPDRGVYDAMNKGVNRATGEYIQFLNADDYLADPGVIARVAERLHQSRPDILYGNLKNSVEISPGRDITREMKTGCKVTLPHPATFMKRDLITRAGMFSLKYSISADRDLIYRTLNFNPAIEYMDEIITIFSLKGMSSSPHLFQVACVIRNQFGFFKAARFYLKETMYPVLEKWNLLNAAKKVQAVWSRPQD